jgi:exodeoxyribonuclease-5
VLAAIGRQYRNALMCAFTGKAASVLRTKTGLSANTIHATFYLPKGKVLLDDGTEDLVFGKRYGFGDLRGTVALFDEASMISEKIATDILGMGVRIVACGDPGQLPPVKGKQFFTEADFTLTQIHRQALNSPIIRQAHRVRSGLPYEKDTANFQVSRFVTMKEMAGWHGLFEADVVMVFYKESKRKLDMAMRAMNGFAGKFPQAGEPVMCRKNAADYGIWNGVTYRLIEPFRYGASSLTVEVDGVAVRVPRIVFKGIASPLPPRTEPVSLFDYGYATTVHRSQGSEWPNVLLLDECPDHQTYKRPWVYTGITRASERIQVMRIISNSW